MSAGLVISQLRASIGGKEILAGVVPNTFPSTRICAPCGLELIKTLCESPLKMSAQLEVDAIKAMSATNINSFFIIAPSSCCSR